MLKFMEFAKMIFRQHLDERAQYDNLRLENTRTNGRRTSGHDESCVCGVQPVRRTATTTTTDSRTLYNSRDDVSLASPQLGRVGSPSTYKRTFSDTTPTGLGIDTLQSLNLAQRKQSNATVESRCSIGADNFDPIQLRTIATGTCKRILGCLGQSNADILRNLSRNRRLSTLHDLITVDY